VATHVCGRRFLQELAEAPVIQEAYQSLKIAPFSPPPTHCHRFDRDSISPRHRSVCERGCQGITSWSSTTRDIVKSFENSILRECSSPANMNQMNQGTIRQRTSTPFGSRQYNSAIDEIRLHQGIEMATRLPGGASSLMAWRDPRQQRLDILPESEALSASQHSIEPPASESLTASSLLTIANSDFYKSLREVISDAQKFSRDDTLYPMAPLETSQGLGCVQLKPDLTPRQPLLPADQDDLALRVWEKLKTLSDLEADLLDILTSNWLKDAKTPNDRATLTVDDIIALRGIKPNRAAKDAAAATPQNQGCTT
jgi:hypothetical protein